MEVETEATQVLAFLYVLYLMHCRTLYYCVSSKLKKCKNLHSNEGEHSMVELPVSKLMGNNSNNFLTFFALLNQCVIKNNPLVLVLKSVASIEELQESRAKKRYLVALRRIILELGFRNL